MSHSVLFGPGNRDCPWYQFDAGIAKEVSEDALEFVLHTVGLYGLHQDHIGYMVDMKVWDALLQYIAWCKQENLDFLFHVDMIANGDSHYQDLSSSKMKALMKSAEVAKS